jgi:hypothetical protein
MVENDYRIGQNITRKTFILHTTTALYRIRVVKGLFMRLCLPKFEIEKISCYCPFNWPCVLQDLLLQRKEKLKLTEAIMKEKTTEEEKLHKYIDAKKRREHYCEKELIERIVFEKEPSKK